MIREYSWLRGLIEPGYLLLTLDMKHQRPQSALSFVTGVKSFDIYCSSLYSVVFLHTNPFSPIYKHGDWPLWLLNIERLLRPLQFWCGFFVRARPLWSCKVFRYYGYCIKKKCWKNMEGIYLQRSEARGRVRGKLQGAISAEKWEWKGWKPINENQYEKAGKHKNLGVWRGGAVIE